VAVGKRNADTSAGPSGGVGERLVHGHGELDGGMTNDMGSGMTTEGQEIGPANLLVREPGSQRQTGL
jgi:hypothetical protein